MLNAVPSVVTHPTSIRARLHVSVTPRFGTTPSSPPPAPLTVWTFLGNLLRGRYDRDLGHVVKIGSLALLAGFIGYAASGRMTSVDEPPPVRHHSAHDPHHGGHDEHHGGHDVHHGGAHGDAHAPGAHGAGGHGKNAGHDNHGHHDMNAELDNFLRRKKQELEHNAGGFNPFQPDH